MPNDDQLSSSGCSQRRILFALRPLRSVGRSETLTLLIYAFICPFMQRACELINLQVHNLGLGSTIQAGLSTVST
jgi:hypothetical protein